MYPEESSAPWQDYPHTRSGHIGGSSQIIVVKCERISGRSNSGAGEPVSFEAFAKRSGVAV